jgi:type III secretion protein L
LAAWEQGLAELAEQHGEYLAQLRGTVADIAMAATTKIIGAQLTDAQQIGKAIEHIIYESGLAGAMKVFLAPTHYQELTRLGGITLQRLGGRQLELQPDPRVGYGGCLLEASAAVVDGRYEVQLKKLQAIVSEFHPASHPGADEDAAS